MQNRIKMKCEICAREIYRSMSKSKRSKSGKFFCSKSCQTKWRNKEFSGEKHSFWKGGQYTYRRLMKNSKIDVECLLCCKKDIRILAVHHLDENRKNNKLSNLAWLCHNCHFMVHHDNVYKANLSKKLADMVAMV
ncbi:MAG TPA: hypothetical protein VEC13_01140 [Candidatus Paceibacterota bacterium]|nr:hypothetical protein [Candidatus Paceibacterota bacterium]